MSFDLNKEDIKFLKSLREETEFNNDKLPTQEKTRAQDLVSKGFMEENHITTCYYYLSDKGKEVLNKLEQLGE